MLWSTPYNLLAIIKLLAVTEILFLRFHICTSNRYRLIILINIIRSDKMKVFIFNLGTTNWIFPLETTNIKYSNVPPTSHKHAYAQLHCSIRIYLLVVQYKLKQQNSAASVTDLFANQVITSRPDIICHGCTPTPDTGRALARVKSPHY